VAVNTEEQFTERLELAANVIKASDTEANREELLSPLARATERA
jgi:hypothetical protein